ncbi:MAG: translation initiation factor [Nannocystaceae bacterium]
MSRTPKIRTSGAPPLSTNPFADLAGALGDLPPGEVPPAPAEPEPTSPPPAPSSPQLRGKIVLRREKKGRGGKTATLIEGLDLPDDALQQMARSLRRSLGCGAHVEGAVVVVGGAQTDRVRAWLAEQGAARIVIGN